MENIIKQPCVSIIVPIYNIEEYLQQCIESLVSQTYENLQIILVDDGSIDHSGELCDQFAEADKRIITIHKENGGLTSARKAGIETAQGEYVMVVDGDDWLDVNTVEQCVTAALANHSDCVMFGYIREYGDNSIENQLFENDFVYNCKESKEKIFRRLIGPIGTELNHPEKLDNFGTICMKLYKYETIRKGKFVSEREIGTNEDTVFNIYALRQCSSITYINKCFYHYRKTNQQSITMKYKPDLCNKWDKMYQEFYYCIKQEDAPELYYKAFYNRIACGMIGLGLNEIIAKDSLLSIRKRIAEILKKKIYRKAFWRLEITYCPVHWKFFFILCRFRCSLLLVFLLKVMNILRTRK